MERRGVRRTLGSWSLGDDGVFKRPDANEEEFEDGWLKTGDVVTVDPDGYVQIVDRAKDVIKSGGEWISSQELENVIMAHDDVSEAIVVGVSHKKWQERPMAFVVPREGADRETIEADIADMLAEDYPEWWLSDDVLYIDSVPQDGDREVRQESAERGVRRPRRRATRRGRPGRGVGNGK